MNGEQKEFLAKSGINLTDGLVYFSENERLYEKYLFRFLEWIFLIISAGFSQISVSVL